MLCLLFQEQEDPLNCCNMDNFIDPAWRSECGFELNYSNDERLIIANKTVIQLSTTTLPPIKSRVNDIKVSPLNVSRFHSKFKICILFYKWFKCVQKSTL